MHPFAFQSVPDIRVECVEHRQPPVQIYAIQRGRPTIVLMDLREAALEDIVNRENRVIEGDFLERMTPYPHLILSTGCDLPRETPLENIRAFMETGRNFRMN